MNHRPNFVIVLSKEEGGTASYSGYGASESPVNRKTYEEVMASEGLPPQPPKGTQSSSPKDGIFADSVVYTKVREARPSIEHAGTQENDDGIVPQSRDEAFESCVQQVVDALKSHADALKFTGPDQYEKAHNPAMTDVTRDLLDAKLEGVRADVRASIAESSKETVTAMGQLNTQMATMQGQMLTEMQGLRADFAHMLKDVTKEMAATNVNVAQLGVKVEGVAGKVEGLEGKVDGLKSSVSMLQTVIGYGIGVAGVIVAVAAIAVAWMQLDFAKKTSTPSAAVVQTAPPNTAQVSPSSPTTQSQPGS